MGWVAHGRSWGRRQLARSPLSRSARARLRRRSILSVPVGVGTEPRAVLSLSSARSSAFASRTKRWRGSWPRGGAGVAHRRAARARRDRPPHGRIQPALPLAAPARGDAARSAHGRARQRGAVRSRSLQARQRSLGSRGGRRGVTRGRRQRARAGARDGRAGAARGEEFVLLLRGPMQARRAMSPSAARVLARGRSA